MLKPCIFIIEVLHPKGKGVY